MVPLESEHIIAVGRALFGVYKAENNVVKNFLLVFQY